ncbi:AMP-binding protein [Sulfurimonas sp. CS5]|uniref:AMP-binding protein n=1 Tax=Sulfurimonas sp. CS5 TaxID=3391145 RepID=UPI0039EC10A1
MILEYIHKDSSRETIDINLSKEISDAWIDINSTNKVEFIKEFLPAYNSKQKIVLFDSNHKQLLKFNQDNDINKFNNITEVNSKCQILFFTSGSSGFPVGAFKTKENLEREVQVLKSLLKEYSIKRVVVTVPFIHIYGVLAGLLLPIHLYGVKLVIKDDFLPYELLEEASFDDTLVVTTPVFIKALSKLNTNSKLTSNLFICSTGPLHIDDVTVFENKFETNLLQLFGSTETGGIAYKFSKRIKWTLLDNVHISIKDNKLNVISPFISPFIFNKKILRVESSFTTEDIVEIDEIDEDKFTLIGRSNKIIKIAGKRISAIQIESIIETIPDVNKAIVELIYKKEMLRSEQIIIILEATSKVDVKIIKQAISKYYGTLTIPFSVKYVDKIDYSAMGKKIIF